MYHDQESILKLLAFVIAFTVLTAVIPVTSLAQGTKTHSPQSIAIINAYAQEHNLNSDKHVRITFKSVENATWGASRYLMDPEVLYGLRYSDEINYIYDDDRTDKQIKKWIEKAKPYRNKPIELKVQPLYEISSYIIGEDSGDGLEYAYEEGNWTPREDGVYPTADTVSRISLHMNPQYRLLDFKINGKSFGRYFEMPVNDLQWPSYYGFDEKTATYNGFNDYLYVHSISGNGSYAPFTVYDPEGNLLAVEESRIYNFNILPFVFTEDSVIEPVLAPASEFDENGIHYTWKDRAKELYGNTSAEGIQNTDNTQPAGGNAAPNGTQFADVPAAEYFATPVQWAVERQITTGRTETSFDPGTGCTRAEIATFLYRATGTDMGTDAASVFHDLASGSFYMNAVSWAVQTGVTSGTSATTFSPGNICTRAEAVTFIWRAKGQPASASAASFADVSENEFYTQAVNWAVANQITQGRSATTFAPNDTCTRADIVTFLYRAFH